ncbi:MAG: hypothetical protein WCA89_09600, partial [Terracidiphilus sp.]
MTMPAPLAAEKLLKFASSLTRDHREAVANLLTRDHREAVANSQPLSKNKNQIHFVLFLLVLTLLTG